MPTCPITCLVSKASATSYTLVALLGRRASCQPMAVVR